LDRLSSVFPFFFGDFGFSSFDSKDGNGSSRHLSLCPLRAFSEQRNCFREISPWWVKYQSSIACSFSSSSDSHYNTKHHILNT
jgi:hypothetical protein